MGCRQKCGCNKRKKMLVVLARSRAEYEEFRDALSQGVRAQYDFGWVPLAADWIVEAVRIAEKAKRMGYGGADFIPLETSAELAYRSLQLAPYYDWLYTGTTVGEVADAAKNMVLLPTSRGVGGGLSYFTTEDYRNLIAGALIWKGHFGDPLLTNSATKNAAVNGENLVVSNKEDLDVNMPLCLVNRWWGLDDLKPWYENDMLYVAGEALTAFQIEAENKDYETRIVNGWWTARNSGGNVVLKAKLLCPSNKVNDMLISCGIHFQNLSTSYLPAAVIAERFNLLPKA